jgi:hypothetical protein
MLRAGRNKLALANARAPDDFIAHTRQRQDGAAMRRQSVLQGPRSYVKYT